MFNAMSGKLTSSFSWKWSFNERRCRILMSSWDKWPETGAGKQRVRISMPDTPMFAAAVPPNELLATVHDRAPMVLLPSQYEAWLDGGEGALSLVGTHPEAEAFAVHPV